MPVEPLSVPEDVPPKTPSRTNRKLTVFALMLSMAMAAMEMTIVSTAMPTIIGELGGLPLYAWVAAVYLLTSTVTVPLYGKLADLYGRKPVLMFGIALFLIGSVACAMASTMPTLIAARALQGLGAGAMQPMALTIIGDLFDIRERGRVQPWFGAVWGVAGLAGPLLGGLLVKHWSWPWVFLINIPFGLGAMVVVSFALRENVAQRPVSLDIGGAFLMTGSVVALLVGIEGVWTGPLLAVAIVTFAAFVFVERRAKDPLVPLDLFTSRVIGTSNALSAILGGVMVGVATYVPLFVQGLAGGTPTEAGAAITPMLVSWPLAAFVAGLLLPRVGYRKIIFPGVLAVAASTLALPLLARPDSSPWVLRAITALMGAGLGCANTALLIAVQSTVPWERRGIATASNMFARTIGATLAVGAMGALLSHVVRDEAHVAPEVMQAVLLRRDRMGPGVGEVVGAIGQGESARLLAALSHGLSLVFWANALLGVMGILLAVFFPPLRTESGAPTRELPATATHDRV